MARSPVQAVVGADRNALDLGTEEMTDNAVTDFVVRNRESSIRIRIFG
jgi:hypothetical protein